VLWKVVDGPAEWIGTKVSFDLKQEGDWTIILFKHQGWREPAEFMHHGSTKWAIFLLSLKSLLETGKGAPAPNEIKLGSKAGPARGYFDPFRSIPKPVHASRRAMSRLNGFR
jgi:hypothetical protein